MKIRIVAPSSVVPRHELKLGLADLKQRGFDFEVDPQVYKKDLFFAGTHRERADALIRAAYSDEVDVIWCARGGYGGNHLLGLLQEAHSKKGRPGRNKLMVGSSDATSLLEFARTRWGFSALHAPMPGLRHFALLPEAEKSAVCDWIRGVKPARPWGRSSRLKWIGKAPASGIEGTISGGNLTVWNTLLGTPMQPRLKAPSLLFLEDVTETLPRLDRAVRHLVDAGGLDGVAAIVLGNFLHCEDAVPSVLGAIPSPKFLRKPLPRHLVPLRRKYSQAEAFKRIFGPITEQLGIPVAFGLPVGHGPEQFSLPMGARVALSASGQFEVRHWDWL